MPKLEVPSVWDRRDHRPDRHARGHSARWPGKLCGTVTTNASTWSRSALKRHVSAAGWPILPDLSLYVPGWLWPRVGVAVGPDIAVLVGRGVGVLVGRSVGVFVGREVGASVGRSVGVFVGRGVGASV